MPGRYKLLILDDDQEMLDLYKDILVNLPSKPEVHTSSSGARAIAMLEAEPFSLLITDLNMPKMDGLQVLSIVRRKYPHLRVVVLSAVTDEQYRSRAYAMGVDLFWEKPRTDQEMKLFQECIESLLGREDQTGFRGVQSKSLVDIVQLECLSQSSAVLKITNGTLEGRIWLHGGEVVDAVTSDLVGEEAFKRVMSWKTGNFEILPPEPDRARVIFNSYQNLLLETAHALDEARAPQTVPTEGEPAGTPPENLGPLAATARMPGVEFVVFAPRERKRPAESWGAENSDRLAEWTRDVQARFRLVGEKLHVGDLAQVVGLGPQRHVAVVQCGESELCVGLNRSLSHEQIRTTVKTVLTKWVS